MDQDAVDQEAGVVSEAAERQAEEHPGHGNRQSVIQAGSAIGFWSIDTRRSDAGQSVENTTKRNTKSGSRDFSLPHSLANILELFFDSCRSRNHRIPSLF